MFDLNEDQGNLTQWWTIRREPMNPRLISDLDDIPEDIEALKLAGYQWCFIDSPPMEVKLIEQAIIVADCVVIPVRTSFLDITASDVVTALCRRHHKPFAYLLCAVDSKMPKLAEQAINTLVKSGPIMASRMSYRQPYIQAMALGKSGSEVKSELQQEIDNIWAEVKQLADGKKLAQGAIA
jgi:chromosome partitioning protein